MNKATKSELRDTLMYLTLGELTIPEALEDIVEIIEEYNQKLNRARRLQLKRLSKKGDVA